MCVYMCVCICVARGHAHVKYVLLINPYLTATTTPYIFKGYIGSLITVLKVCSVINSLKWTEGDILLYNKNPNVCNIIYINR